MMLQGKNFSQNVEVGPEGALYFYFSAAACQQNGCSVYVGWDGRSVITTNVVSKRVTGRRISGWADEVYIGSTKPPAFIHKLQPYEIEIMCPVGYKGWVVRSRQSSIAMYYQLEYSLAENPLMSPQRSLYKSQRLREINTCKKVWDSEFVVECRPLTVTHETLMNAGITAPFMEHKKYIK